MKNKLFTAALFLSLLSPVAVAQASVTDTPVLAVLDTAIDTTLPQFKDKIVGEVCILEWALCPNGTKFQEGPGAASMPANLINLNGFDHGTIMTDVAIKNNPNMKILFIKIIGNTPTGLRKPSGESTISAALFWVRENAARYNIQAVSLAQGTHVLGKAGTSYCPVYPRTISAIDSLLAMDIPVFAASGNNRDYERIDWPSCIPNAVAIGAVDQINEMTTYSNTDPVLLDFFALGNMSAAGPGNVMKNVAGTSASTQVAAAKYLTASKQFGYRGQKLIDKLKAISVPTVGRQGKFNKLMSLVDVSSSTIKVVSRG